MAKSSRGLEMVLPVELIDHLLYSYLSVRDLLNLSATNTFWRNRVNQDLIWKKFCVRYFNADPLGKPLIHRIGDVKPPYEMVTNISENLSDLCPWRTRYAQEIYARNSVKVRGKKLRKFMAIGIDIDLIHKMHATKDMDGIDFLFDKPNYSVFGKFVVYHTSNIELIEIWMFKNYTFIKIDSIEIDYRYELYYTNRNSTRKIRRIEYLRNGFVVLSWPYMYFYELKDDGFKLKVRTIATKAIHPEIPLMCDLSELIDISLCIEHSRISGRFSYDDVIIVRVHNEKLIVFCKEDSHPEFRVNYFVWDFQNFKTFCNVIYCCCSCLYCSPGDPDKFRIVPVHPSRIPLKYQKCSLL